MTLARTIAVSMALVLPFATGCGSKPESGSQTASYPPALPEVGDLLRAAGASGRAPTKVADLTKFESAYPTAFQAVQSGEVVVVWGAKMPDEGDAATAPDHVLAYEKNVPTEGGWVLLLNGNIKQMTAEEFKAAPKAK